MGINTLSIDDKDLHKRGTGKMHKLAPKSSPTLLKPLRRSFRARFLRIILISISVLIVLAVLLGGIVIWFSLRTLPQTTGTLSLSGLTRPVTVIRDQWGVPHITTSNLHDLIFAQGYVTSQDRLFEMEVNRHLAQGRLSEMFGRGSNNSLVQADTFLRTLGLYRAAQSSVATLDSQSRTEIQAYVDGVNVFLTTHKNNLPLEFSILGITPEPWTLVDSLAYGRFLAFTLDYSWYYKYTRAFILAKAGPAVTSELFPSYPATNPTLINASTQATTPGSPATPAFASAKPTVLSAKQLAAFSHLPTSFLQGADVIHVLLGSVSEGLGSNNWVVDGSRTTTGKPLLANDPHLAITMPSLWYEVALHDLTSNLIGFSLPGVPGIIIGHNDHIAWGVTNAVADDADLYLETLDSANHPSQYLYNGHWLPLETRREIIHIHGETQPTIITVISTAHGPLLNSAVNDLKHHSPVSLKWTALQLNYDFTGFFQLNFATNWQQFTTALSHISVSQNFVYADVQGNIGYRLSGLLPVRSADNDLVPVDGSTPAHEWHGYVSQQALPWLFNPPTHFIATANNQIVPGTSPVYISSQWDQGYRARRITDLLIAKPQLSIADFKQIQADIYSIPASQLTPYLIAAGQANGGDAAAAAKLLQRWNFTMTSESSAAAVFEVTAGNLLRELLETVLGKTVYSVYVDNILESNFFLVLFNLFTHPQALFFNSTTNSQALMARDKVIVHALQDTMSQLRAKLGSDTSLWHWGRLHQAHFNHSLATEIPFNFIFGVAPVDRPGDSVTINVGGDGAFPVDPPEYQQLVVSSMREIIDLANLDNSLWIIPTGESGQPYSAHYTDLLALWNQNQYQHMDFSRHAELKAGRETLVLQSG